MFKKNLFSDFVFSTNFLLFCLFSFHLLFVGYGQDFFLSTSLSFFFSFFSSLIFGCKRARFAFYRSSFYPPTKMSSLCYAAFSYHNSMKNWHQDFKTCQFFTRSHHPARNIQTSIYFFPSRVSFPL